MGVVRVRGTPLPTSPARGEVLFRGWGGLVQRAPDCTSPLAGEAGWGVQRALRFEGASR